MWVEAWILQLIAYSMNCIFKWNNIFQQKLLEYVFESPTLVVFTCQSIAQEKSQTASRGAG